MSFMTHIVNLIIKHNSHHSIINDMHASKSKRQTTTTNVFKNKKNNICKFISKQSNNNYEGDKTSCS